MVDGILTKLRNPVNQDSWLTDRFNTSVNHSLFLSLHYMVAWPAGRPDFQNRIRPSVLWEIGSIRSFVFENVAGRLADPV